MILSELESEDSFVGNVRLKFSVGQVLMLVLIISVLIGLAAATTSSSNRAVSQAKVMTQAESTSSSIIFTQREALVYGIRYSQWLGGSITRRDVQIARALLAQRLSVVDVGGISMGARATPEFAEALADSDAILDSAPAGFLPANLSEEYSRKAAPVISEIIDHARKLIVAYQQDLDTQFRKAAVDRADSARLNLVLLAILILLTTIFLFWIAIDFRRKYLQAKSIINEEQITLFNARDELEDARGQLVVLQDLNVAKNDFISTINHELRTPLTSIIGYVDLLKNSDHTRNEEEFRKIVSILESNSTALLDLVESILSLTKLDSEVIAAEYEVQNLLPILDNVLVMLSLQAKTKEINLSFQVDTNEQYLAPGNRTQISQVFVNLISNAIKFSEPGSNIEISLKRVVEPNFDVQIEFEVRDHGMGIPVSDMDKLFTRFFRAKNAADSHVPGTGLGLAIVKKTMELHRGKVLVTSVEGQGSTFTLIFPGIKSEVEKMVEERRLVVLAKAIKALEDTEPENLSAVCHNMGGAISFYTFEDEGAELEKFSIALQSEKKLTNSQIELKRKHLIDYLKLRQSELTTQKVGKNE